MGFISNIINFSTGSVLSFLKLVVQADGDTPIEPTPPGFEQASEYVGAVGNFISAILQSAGLFGQSDVLHFYAPALESMAAFLFLVSFAAALGAVAVFGKYRQAAYFLIGPSLFYMMITGTVPGEYTLVKTGTDVLPDYAKKQEELLSAFIKDTDGIEKLYGRELRLSWFFVMYDNLISSVTQGIVSVLIDTENKEHIINVARERALAEVFAGRGIDPFFNRIVHQGLMGEQCREVTGKQLNLSEPRFVFAENGSPEAEQKVKAIEELNVLKEQNRVNIDSDIIEHLRNIDSSSLQDIGAVAPGDDWLEIVNKPVHNCDDVWKFARALAQVEANRITDDIANRDPGTNETPWDEVAQEIKDTLSDPDETDPETREAQANKIIAVSVLKNALRQTTQSNMIYQMDTHASFNHAPDFFDDIMSDRYTAEAQGAMFNMVFFQGMIPYVQGLFLFLLSCAFPFFCVFLVMPGRAIGFVTWMTLWLWVKSWDVGFAIIHVIRELLWEWLGRAATPYLHTNIGIQDIPDASTPVSDMEVVIRFTDVDWEDPSAIFHAIAQADPLANINTYYMIISVLVVSVPLFTAHLCLGATDVFEAFKNTLSSTGQRFGNAYRNRISQSTANRFDVLMEQKGHAYAMRQVEAFRQFHSNEGDRKALAAKLGDFTDGKFGDIGDGSHAAAARALYQQSLADYHFGKEKMDDSRSRAAVTTRVATWSGNMDAKWTKGDKFGLLRDFYGMRAGGDTMLPIWGENKPRMDNLGSDASAASAEQTQASDGKVAGQGDTDDSSGSDD